MLTEILTGGQRLQTAPYWAGLLERFYKPKGLPLPAFWELPGTEVPPPYQSLLVHSSDMTSTLTNFYGQKLRLNVLSREHTSNSYKREVILQLAEDQRPVEYGVIQIYLEHLPPTARGLVLREERPLGDILQSEAIPYLSWPQAFFRLKADARTGAALELRHPGFLYGRRNVLLNSSRRLVAEVIEVLAPADRQASTATSSTLKIRKYNANRKPRPVNGRRLKRLSPARVRA